MEERVRDAFRDPMNIAMLDGLADETGSIGAGLLLLTETANEGLSIASAPVDAVVLVGCSTSFDDSVAILRQRGLPIVAVEAPRMDGVLPIDLDNRVSSATAARHLRDARSRAGRGSDPAARAVACRASASRRTGRRRRHPRSALSGFSE